MTAEDRRPLVVNAFRRWPHPAISVAVVLAHAVALYPGTLPRDAATTAGLTAALAGLGAILGMVWAGRSAGDPDVRARRVVFGCAVVVLVATVGVAAWWQNMIRGAVGAAPVGLGWCAAVTLVPAALVVAVVAVPRATAVVAASAMALTAGFLAPAGAEGKNPAASSVSASADDSRVLRGELNPGDFDGAATALVDKWLRAGGASARAVVVAVPTGSGWVDRTAVDGFVRRFGGDVRIVTLPYADVPSWRAFVAERSLAADSAIAVVRRLVGALDDREPATGPRVVLYGQSLGAVGADAARIWLEDHRPSRLDSTVLTAPPAGTVAPTSDSARTVVVNHSDPVPRWSTATLWLPPPTAEDTRLRGPRVPVVPWIPVVSFLQASVDLLDALDGSAGVGHRYGTDQAQLPMVRSADLGCQTMSPRAASYDAPTR
ncbi:alpha/beta-hydrolase family protein [Gordonia sp. zg691]|uniref:alpha/beta-hydrolase family protein n=1 Tax=Gordonia jinghuaiqii TaxID=2758710 RepID=UPI0016622EA4|nr:alpha/beta-hydrolase family protein [Gordonia jinghuaiqii]MBD0859863.1 alpha/beta-hydrolase family protein [Gordonia jinghuaiqii]